MSFQSFLLILRARYLVALLVLVLTVATATAVSLMMPKKYSATTSIVVDVKSPDPVAGMVLPGLIAPSYMATQFDIITSDRVAQRVVKLLGLDKNQTVRDQWQEATGGEGDLTAWVSQLLRASLDVKPSKESNVINIGFLGQDPAFAAAVANAFAKAYLEVNLELRVEPARQYADWFDGQTKTLRERLEQAQSALSAYQQNNNILAIDEQRVDYEKGKLTELSQALTAIQAQTSDSSSKRQATGSSETLADVMQNPVVMSLKSDINRLEAKLEESNVNLGRNHPQTQRTESELASLKDMLAAETRKITASINTTYGVGRQREKELTQALEDQKRKVLDMNQRRDEIGVLKRDLDAAQRAFDSVSARATQTRLESQSVQTNVAILNTAMAPADPSKPNIPINIAASVIIGSFLGVGIALLLELGNRRVRSAEDLAAATDLPVLASISAAAKPRGRRGGPFERREPMAAA